MFASIKSALSKLLAMFKAPLNFATKTGLKAGLKVGGFLKKFSSGFASFCVAANIGAIVAIQLVLAAVIVTVFYFGVVAPLTAVLAVTTGALVWVVPVYLAACYVLLAAARAIDGFAIGVVCADASVPADTATDAVAA